MDVFSEFKRIPLSEYLTGQGFNLSRVKAHSYKMCCPFHDDKNPSLVVDDQKGTFRCFVCPDVKGDIFDFETLRCGSSKEAMKTLCDHFGVSRTEHNELSSMHKSAFYAKEVYRRALMNPKYPAIKDYLMGRGLSERTLELFDVGFCPTRNYLAGSIKHNREDFIAQQLIVEKNDSCYDFFAHRITFPIKDATGQVVGFGGRAKPDATDTAKYINSAAGPLYDKSRTVYGLHEAKVATGSREFECLYVVEGYMDVLACHEMGLPNVVACCGTSVSEEHLRLLFQYTNRVVFLLDGDQAGFKGLKKALEAALPVVSLTKMVSWVSLGSDMDAGLVLEKGKGAWFKSKLDLPHTLDEYFRGELAVVYGTNLLETACLREQRWLDMTRGMDADLVRVLRPFIESALHEGT